MFGLKKIIEKSIDLTEIIFSFIDDSDFTPEEKARKKNEVKKLNLDKLKVKSSVLIKALKIGYSDSVSSNKFQSYARPSIIWLFVFMILFSIPLGILSYFYNDFVMSVLDTMNMYFKIIPDAVYYGFFGVIGVYKFSRGYEKVKGVSKWKNFGSL